MSNLGISPEVRLVQRAQAAGAAGLFLAPFEELARSVIRERVRSGAASADECLRIGARMIALKIRGATLATGCVVPLPEADLRVCNALVDLIDETFGRDEASPASHEVLVEASGRATVRSTGRVQTSAGHVELETETTCGPEDVQRVARELRRPSAEGSESMEDETR